MKPLPAEFKGTHGFRFKILKRKGNVVLLLKTHDQITRPIYEVCIVKVANPRTFPDGTTIGEREVLPSSEQWGYKGWTPIDEQAAYEKFHQLVRDREV